MASWFELPRDIAQTLLEKIELPQDFVRFSLVCKPWLSVAREHISRLPYKLPMSNFLPIENPLPMLLKPSIEDPNTFSLYCVTNNKIFDGLYAPEINNKWIVGSIGGWLVTVDIKGTEINLTNPLTRKQISLPPIDTIPNPINDIHGANDKFYFVNKVYLFSNPVEDPENCIVVAFVLSMQSIAYCRIGDKKWTKMEKILPLAACDIIKHNNILYALDCSANLFAIDLKGNIKVTLVAQYNRFANPGREGYLMDLSGKLLLLQRYMGDEQNSLMTCKFEIFELKEVSSYSDYYVIEADDREHDADEYATEDWVRHNVDEIRYQWSEVKSIGDQTVFVGYNQTMWFDSRRYPGCKANCIYFADDMIGWDVSRVYLEWGDEQGGRDVGIYHIDDDRIEPFSGFSSCPLAQTVWLSPILG
ncbi:hypothetical protein LUZ60_013383 [Juncus effusus]|nr:hypothetical protein LUZ60_013383 [Juncus effusus]